MEEQKKENGSSFTYFMEMPDEAVRLLSKDRTGATHGQLLETGIAELPDSPCLVDAGTGAGVVAMQMAELASTHYGNASVTLLDGSTERMAAAEKNLQSYTNVDKQFVTCNLEDIPLPNNSVDYLFCRFVFEYLSNQKKVFREFKRILKPGGKLVVGDLDYNSITHYPLSEIMQGHLNDLMQAVEKLGLMDLYAGRKLYSYFFNEDFRSIKVHFHAHHLFYGKLDESDAFNWSKKLDQLINYQTTGAIELGFDIKKFKVQFMEFLKSPERFSYTPLILVEGVK